MLDLFLKTGFSKAYQGFSQSQWVCLNNNDAYSHGWSLLKPIKNETLRSQGLLDYSHGWSLLKLIKNETLRSQGLLDYSHVV